MLKHHTLAMSRFNSLQPPSGGCVLKLSSPTYRIFNAIPAAFRRLCVETSPGGNASNPTGPAAFRRLCVETSGSPPGTLAETPAAFRRLCVETADPNHARPDHRPQPPSGGCVLKQPDLVEQAK